jgi:hypothetical protein
MAEPIERPFVTHLVPFHVRHLVSEFSVVEGMLSRSGGESTVRFAGRGAPVVDERSTPTTWE